MSENNPILDTAEELLRRVSPEGRARARRLRERKRRAFARLMQKIAIAAIAIMTVTGAFGLFVAPVSSAGELIAIALFCLVAFAIIRTSREREPTPQAIAAGDLPRLPQRTEEWLETQRRALPPPAARLLDGIGSKLESMAPQLEGLEPDGPAAGAVRKLLCDELPELVKGYQRVPQHLRGRPGATGPSPDRQLCEGLTIIDSEISRMTQQLASGDLDLLATRGRYLELKYRSGDALSGGA
ncbi:MAG TPA: hypothetical protein VGF77_14875 [Allosphingosinicella sp.]|jgi:hypothetical protein